LKTPDTYHHKEDRLLTRSELKIIATFPKEYKLIGNLRNIYNRIGNSVPPLFMKAIAEHIKENILEKSKLNA
jgi:DNA (cytosine-5)-methyltransferase 1